MGPSSPPPSPSSQGSYPAKHALVSDTVHNLPSPTSVTSHSPYPLLSKDASVNDLMGSCTLEDSVKVDKQQSPKKGQTGEDTPGVAPVVLLKGPRMPLSSGSRKRSRMSDPRINTSCPPRYHPFPSQKRPITTTLGKLLRPHPKVTVPQLPQGQAAKIIPEAVEAAMPEEVRLIDNTLKLMNILQTLMGCFQDQGRCILDGQDNKLGMSCSSTLSSSHLADITVIPRDSMSPHATSICARFIAFKTLELMDAGMLLYYDFVPSVMLRNLQERRRSIMESISNRNNINTSSSTTNNANNTTQEMNIMEQELTLHLPSTASPIVDRTEDLLSLNAAEAHDPETLARSIPSTLTRFLSFSYTPGTPNFSPRAPSIPSTLPAVHCPTFDPMK